MKTPAKIVIILVVAVAAVAAVALKGNKAQELQPLAVTLSFDHECSRRTSGDPCNAKLPKLLDLGAGKCIPCKMMTPILEELKRDYADRFDVEFIDVWENPDAGKQYGIEMIPTQIFYDAEGKELFRHVGFFGKEDILGKWKELGVDLSGARRRPASCARRRWRLTRARATACASCATKT